MQEKPEQRKWWRVQKMRTMASGDLKKKKEYMPSLSEFSLLQ